MTSRQVQPKVILSIESSRSIGCNLLRGIARYSRVKGPWRFYSEPGGKEPIPNLASWEADGIIANVINKKSAVGIEKLAIASVTKEMKLQGRPRISANGELIGKMAAEHFLEKGFRHFAYYCLINAEWTKKRGDAFAECVGQKGCGVDFFPVKGTIGKSWQIKQQLLADWLGGLDKPLAVLAGNDEQGRHVIEACRLADLRVPYDVAVLGVDNDDIVCDLCEPRLSSIALDSESAGFRAAEVLDKLMSSGQQYSDEEIVIQPTYVIQRHSTDILAVEDAAVSDAMRFIRENTRDNITVDEVALAAAVSRRVLEKKFNIMLNSTILKEIRLARTRTIETMLMETDMSISQIAEALDFPGIDHFSRYFKLEAGVSPLAYRKLHKHK
jgi:LacI family transcriptional regulator